MDGRDLSKAFEGVARLAQVGAAAIFIGFLALVIGGPVLLWWLWSHVSIAIH